MPAAPASAPDSLTRRHWLAAALAMPALSLTACATAHTAAPTWQAWPLPGVRSFDLPTAPLPGSGAPRQHRVMVYVPQGPAPAAGWPVIYVLDGNLMFPMVAQLVHNRGARGGDLRGASAVVVGLGHALPEGSAEVHDRAARTYDYTLPYEGVGPDGQGRAQGGADVFLDFIAQQLQPRLQAALPLNLQQQTLVGHSYGGLCTLHALFTRPGMFQRHVAASPSLWWGGGVVLRECQTFMDRYRASGLPHALRLYLSQGSEELASRNSPSRPPNPEREAAARAAQQLGSTADLPAMLAAVQGLSCHYQVWPGANHGGTQLYACMQAAQVGVAWG
jgi:predicted alpha/beta superfamily hydrolase